ncbi:hypothetical protein GW17_00020209, partial [Ensete ventricosum]
MRRQPRVAEASDATGSCTRRQPRAVVAAQAAAASRASGRVPTADGTQPQLRANGRIGRR